MVAVFALQGLELGALLDASASVSMSSVLPSCTSVWISAAEPFDPAMPVMKEHFRDEQLVEITALLTVINLDRFNAAFGIGSAGFSEGMVCVAPDRPTANPALTKIA